MTRFRAWLAAWLRAVAGRLQTAPPQAVTIAIVAGPDDNTPGCAQVVLMPIDCLLAVHVVGAPAKRLDMSDQLHVHGIRASASTVH
jgi:hypothetical protein